MSNKIPNPQGVCQNPWKLKYNIKVIKSIGSFTRKLRTHLNPPFRLKASASFKAFFFIKMKVGYHALNSQKTSVSASSPVCTPKGEKDESLQSRISWIACELSSFSHFTSLTRLQDYKITFSSCVFYTIGSLSLEKKI